MQKGRSEAVLQSPEKGISQILGRVERGGSMRRMRQKTIIRKSEGGRGLNPPKENNNWEENQKKKDYLNGYKDAKRKERRINEQIQKLRMDKMFPSIQYDDMPRGTGISDLSDYIERVEELIEELKIERLKAIRQYDKIYRDVRQVEDERERDVLVYRYLQELDWEAIYMAMGLKRTQTHEVHKTALENFNAGGAKE